MASPFAVFRRNQKILLATVGIGAMVAFVFLPPLTQYMGGSAKQANPVVVETDYGSFTQSELDNLEFSRDVVDRFLQRVTTKVIANQVGQGNLDARLYQTLAERHYMIWRQQLMARSQQGPEKAAIETLVLSRRAEQMGMVISDQAINDLLKQITDNSVTPAELQEIIRGLQPTRPIGEKWLFEAIRTEMLAAEYAQLFVHSLRDVPPAQRFEYYSRLNRRATAEVMPLAVADFVGQVADPGQEEIKKFYDVHKNDYPNPDSPEPGFKEPKRATFQCFEADIDQLTDRIKPEITEQEIATYYDKNKEQFRAFDFDDKGAAEKLEAEGKEGERGPEGEKPANEPKSPDDKGTEPESEKPGEKQPAAESEKPSEEKPAQEKPAEEKPSQPKAQDNTENKDDSAPQAGLGTGRSIVLTSATLAGDDPPDDSQPAGENPNEKNAPAEATSAEGPGTPPAKPETSAPAADKTAGEKPPDASQDEPAAGQTTEKAAEKPAEEKPAEEPRFEPLAKVADTIRTTLARQKAEERVREQFDELSGEMRRYTDEQDIYTAEKGTNPRAKPPVPLNFSELAKGKDVQARELKSVTAEQVAEEGIGKAFRIVQSQGSPIPMTVPFVNFAFAETLPTYKAEVIQNNDNDAFLFWKTQEEPAYVPPLDQIRDKVVRAWKLIKAREVARKRALEYAVQARALKKPLQELFGTQTTLKISDTGPFSWLTLGNVPEQPGAQPRLSEVEGVDRGGPEFMKAVFSLEAGGIGISLNEPETIVYTIRLIAFEPVLDELRDDFARTNPSRYMAAAGDDQRAIYQAWLAELNSEAGVHWIRQADTRRQTDQDDAEF
ncbi:MAG: hypothetical protein WD063_09095 [Pirellulales bacterium]